MQNQYPLLIIAQSARFIAESAMRTGYRVRVADCFGDTDVLAIAEQYQPLPPLEQWTPATLLTTINILSQNEPCELIIGSGLEHRLDVLDQLPSHIHFIGNTLTTLKQLRDAQRFFALLDKLYLPYPKTVFSADHATKGFLQKKMQSCGGQGVSFTHVDSDSSDSYFQLHITGQSCSATFISNGQTAELLAINQQLHDADFRLLGLSQPYPVSDKVLHTLKKAIHALTIETGLRGFNSLDFMLNDDDELFLLEVNPRISASVELLPIENVLSLHRAACEGLPLTTSKSKSSDFRQLRYLFTDKALQVLKQAEWPAECRDIPAAGTLIQAGEPICSIIVSDKHPEQLKKKHQTVEQQVLKNCLCDA